MMLDLSYYRNKYAYKHTDTFLGRGVNLGNFLEAPVDYGYPLGEGRWTGGRIIQQSDFVRIKTAGFKSVRIPIRWSAHASLTGPDYRIDKAFVTRVKQVVDWAMAENLNVVINCHHYEPMMDSADPAPLATHKERLAAIWNQICTLFPAPAYTTDRLVFELLNEPVGRVGSDEWAAIIDNLTTVIWRDNADTQIERKIIVGTINWGSITGLESLTLPDVCNRFNTIITIHYYEPFSFTHQGANWVAGSSDWCGTPWTGSASDQQPILEHLESIMSWNAAPERGFEIYIGEFGVYSQYADPACQQAWTAFIAREAEKRKMSWAYWEYAAGFGAYNPQTNIWREPLLQALIPSENRT
ncbi:MAG TPA: glycoside hydrolase family 5 protein [Bacillota bacterium]|nr:glycoside hydrolase family 5 protein [Bacillota bacterium]